MLLYFFIFLIAVSTFVAFDNWRRGLFFMLLIGALQDPVRKMTPGVPPILVLSIVPVWLAICVNVFQSEPFMVEMFARMYGKLWYRIKLFLLMILPGAVVMLMHGLFLWPAVLLGAFSYTCPMVAMVVGFAFGQSRQQIISFLVFYCLLTAVMLSGTVLEYLNVLPDWQALGTGAMNMVWVKYVSYGHTIYMKAGFYRSPDMMGWHGATMIMTAFTLYFLNRSNLSRSVWICLAAWGLLCIVLSGRYKMIAMPMVWAVTFAVLVTRFRGSSQMISLIGIGVLVIVGMNLLGSKIGLDDDFLLYAKSPISYSTERLEKHGIGAVVGTYRQSGFFGNGLGSATQGARHTGTAVRKGWQEGGLSKIMAELGVGGLVFFCLFALSLFMALLTNIRSISLKGDLLYLHSGLVSIIVANAVSFIVSSQAYGDVNILVLISLFPGIVLSSQRWS